MQFINILSEISLLVFLTLHNAVTVLLNLASNVIAAYRNSVLIPVAIHKLVCSVRMHHVQPANAVIYKPVNHIKRVLCAVLLTVNAIYPNIVPANPNIVQMIILSVIQNCAAMEKPDAIRDLAVRVMINANCYGDHQANHRNNAMKKIQREPAMVIAAMIDLPIRTRIVPRKIYSAACCNAAI